MGLAGDDLLWRVGSSPLQVAQRYRSLLEAHANDVDIETTLGDTLSDNLEFYGHGVKAYTLSMIESAIAVTEGRVSAADIAAIIGFGKELANSPVELTEWARPTLVGLTDRYRLLLLAQGDLFEQEARVARSGLAELFWHIDVVREKDEPTYRRILASHQVEPGEFVMVGPSVRADVEPVVAIGATAVYLPAEPTWETQLGLWGDAESAHAGAVHQIAVLGDLPEVLAQLG